MWMWVAAGALAALTALAVWQAALHWFTRVPAEKRIAVLPFRNVGNAPENQALCDGLMEVLTSELTELEQFQGTLWVVPSTEVRREQLSSAEGARRALGANLVIVGSVQRDAQQVYLTASVVDAKTLRQLSSRSLRKSLADLADLQESVVREIARMLELHLGSDESQALSTRQTKAAGAYDFYLQAQGCLQRRSVADLDHAIDLLNRAVAQDPNTFWPTRAWEKPIGRSTGSPTTQKWVEPAQKKLRPRVGVERPRERRCASPRESYRKAWDAMRRPSALSCARWS
jgi:TolB-like protein